MINPRETQRARGGKQNAETVHYVGGGSKIGKDSGEREERVREGLISYFPKNAAEGNNA